MSSTGKLSSRRAILRTTGAALAMPLVEALVPARVPFRGRLAAASAAGAPEPQRPFAQVIKAAVASGEFPGAVAAVETPRLLRVESFGYRDLASKTPIENNTICRVGSMAKTVHAAAALRLMEDKRFRLDDKVTKWAPELANHRVLRTPTSEIDDTVPARRDMTMYDVLTFQLGVGIYLGGGGRATPILKAMQAKGVAPVTEPVPFGPDEFMSRLASLPWPHHPGDAFMYHTGDDVLRILLRRIAGKPIGDVLHDRVFEPLGMVDSGVSVPAAKRNRFATGYLPPTKPGEPLKVWDPTDGRFAKDPIYPNQFQSTVADYLTFARMLLNDGVSKGRRFLSAESVALMMTNHLSEEQKRNSNPGGGTWWQPRGWGMGGVVYTKPTPQAPNPGSYSWYGGYGGNFLFDKKRGAAIIAFVPRNSGPRDRDIEYAFEESTYRDVLSSDA